MKLVRKSWFKVSQKLSKILGKTSEKYHRARSQFSVELTRIVPKEPLRRNPNVTLCRQKLHSSVLPVRTSFEFFCFFFRYKESITKVSNILWDQPIKPLDNAVWWTEYVIRHGGAQHLRSPGVDQSWFKLLCVDIISFLISLILTVSYIVYRIVIIVKTYLDVKRRKIKMA